MLGVVTFLGIAFGLCWWLSAPAIVALIMALLVVGAHVFGNAVGTRLRSGPAKNARQSTSLWLDDRPAAMFQDLPPAAPASHLSERWPLGWGLTIATATGGLLGMVGGCLWIERAYHIGFDPSGLAVAGAGFGVLGGFASFAVASFSQVMIVAFLQALRDK